MKLREKLHRIQHKYHLELWQTYLLTQETYEQLINSLKTPKVLERLKHLPEDEQKKIWEEVRNSIEQNKDSLSPLAKELQTAKKTDYLSIERRLNNLAEMALIYLVTLMEAFTKEYLVYLYANEPYLLRCGKSITYEEVLAFGDMPTLYQALAEREVDQISYKNVDQLADYLNSKFNLDLDKRSKAFWNICRESSYRRNIVVHNRGIVNSVYTSKISDSPELGSKLGISVSYLHNVTIAIKEYISFVDSSLVEKLQLEDIGLDKNYST